MLFHHLTTLPADPSCPAVITSSGQTTWQQLSELTHRRHSELGGLAAERVGVRVPATADGLAVLAALDGLGATVFLFDELLESQAAVDLAGQLGLHAVAEAPLGPQQVWNIVPVPAAAPRQASATAGVTILTSGTEGTPKAASHTWQSLSRPVRRREAAEPQRWLLSFRIHLYAGLQVVLQSVLNYGTLVIPAPGDSPDEVVRLMEAGQVAFASATPSYWRRLILFADRARLSAIPLRQITLGGEAVDQQVLDSLAAIFPQARIAHIYATTELGRCFSVTDGQAGFPAEYLQRGSVDGVELKVLDGQLYVRSANAMRRYDRSTESLVIPAPAGRTGAPLDFDADGWFATGDLVELRGDRVHFAGRRGEMINVGGNKVQPLVVERIVREVPGVADARVFPQSSSLAGQLVACEFVAEPGSDPAEVKRLIAERCSEHLPGFQRPRFIECVRQIELTSAGKSRRL